MAASEAWERARHEASQAASRAAHAWAQREGRGGPQAAALARQAAIEAIHEYERATPRPEFNGQPTVALWLTDEKEKV